MIEFESVTKQFVNGTIAFEQLSFKIGKGGMMAITGPSGSGKTTIMKLLIKEYEPTKGDIWLEEQSLKKIKRRKIAQHRQKIGVVFQDYKLIEDLNVWENIALPLNIKSYKQKKIESRVTDLLKLVGLTDKALVFPCQLSGGEAQRVSIARALATGPRIIFADEPTGNLDAETSVHIIDLLKKINKLGTTLLLASHDQLVLERLSEVPKISLSRHPSHQETDSSQDKAKKKPKHKTKKAKRKSTEKDEGSEEKKQKESQKQKIEKSDKKDKKAKQKQKKNKPKSEKKKKKKNKDKDDSWKFKGLGKFFSPKSATSSNQEDSSDQGTKQSKNNSEKKKVK